VQARARGHFPNRADAAVHHAALRFDRPVEVLDFLLSRGYRFFRLCDRRCARVATVDRLRRQKFEPLIEKSFSEIF